MPTATNTLRNDAQVIGLIGLGHGTSHFFQLILAPLFPWLKDAFGLSYAELGLLMTMFFVVSGIGQALAGFVVDKVGALPVLLAGLTLSCVSAIGLATSNSYAMLMLFSAVAGLGNSVFHPADFTLLNHRVSTRRLGHAFSVHGLSGALGWAAAPIFLAGLATLFDWRVALLAAAAMAFVVLAILFLWRDLLDPPASGLDVLCIFLYRGTVFRRHSELRSCLTARSLCRTVHVCNRLHYGLYARQCRRPGRWRIRRGANALPRPCHCGRFHNRRQLRTACSDWQRTGLAGDAATCRHRIRRRPGRSVTRPAGTRCRAQKRNWSGLRCRIFGHGRRPGGSTANLRGSNGRRPSRLGVHTDRRIPACRIARCSRRRRTHGAGTTGDVVHAERRAAQRELRRTPTSSLPLPLPAFRHRRRSGKYPCSTIRRANPACTGFCLLLSARPVRSGRNP